MKLSKTVLLLTSLMIFPFSALGLASPTASDKGESHSSINSNFAFKQEITDVNVVSEGPFWVSEWREFQLPAGLASFQIQSFGSPEVFIQITDLIAPDGKAYVQSNF